MKIRRPSLAKSRIAKKQLTDSDTPQGAVPSEASPVGRWAPWAMLLLVILLTAAVRIRLLETPLERDEGEYAYAGQLLLQRIPPYEAAYSMKFPGVYAAYAVIMAAFGQTIGGIHFGFLLLNAGTIVLVFLLGRRLFSASAGVAAAAGYALLSVGAGILGTQAHATHFVIAAALGGTLLLLQAIESGSSARFFWSGLLYGVAILMKQQGALFAIFGALYLLARCRRRRVFASSVFLSGLIAPIVLTGMALWQAGVFGKFWFWTVDYAREYVTEVSFNVALTLLKINLEIVVGPNLQLWLLAAVGLVAIWWRKENRAAAAFASAFLVFSILAVCPGWYFRSHYFVLMLPAIALLGGAIVSSTMSLTWLLYGAVLAISIFQQREFLFFVSPVQAIRQMLGNCPFPEAIEVGSYLRAHSSKDARIAVLGSEPEIYFYAQRRSATGYIYTYGMMEHQQFALAMQNEMIGEVEKTRPEYVVLVNIVSSWLRRHDSNVRIADWWDAYQPANYRLAGAVDILSTDRTEYHWDHLEAYQQRSPPIAIYKRIDK